MSEPDFNERKAKTVERHLTHTERFLQRQQNLQEKKLRGGKRPRRPSAEDGDGDGDWDSDDWDHDPVDVSRPRPSQPSSPRRNDREASTAQVASEIGRAHV